MIDDPVGNWLFPNAAPRVRRLRMEVVWCVVFFVLLLCAALGLVFWLGDRPHPF